MPGSVHDSRMCQNSGVFQLKENDSALIMGDKGYAGVDEVLTPFKGKNVSGIYLFIGVFKLIFFLKSCKNCTTKDSTKSESR